MIKIIINRVLNYAFCFMWFWRVINRSEKISDELSIRCDGALILKKSENVVVVAERWQFQPLSYLAIDAHVKNKKESKFVITSLLLKSSSGEVFDNISIDFDASKIQLYAITIGGWLPSVFALRNAYVLADRNVISRLNSNLKSEFGCSSNWLDVLHYLNPKFDIIWFGLEANKKRHPTHDEIKGQLIEAFNAVRNNLPGIEIVKYPISVESYIRKIITGIEKSVLCRKEFFKNSSPYLKSSSDLDTIKVRWVKIIEAAGKSNLDKNDISVLLALICVSAPQKDSPGIGVIKPDNDYTDELAYNAALDVQIIELLINMQLEAVKRNLGLNYVILTADANLAKLGAFLSGLRNILSEGDIITLGVKMPHEVFGRHHDQLKTLYAQLMK